jgi:uncharacterized SAM-binding protein YcdF (DUF218 family)
MFYVLSKVSWVITAPTSLIVLVCGITMLWSLLRGGRYAIRLTAASVIALFVLCFTPASLWIARPLESRFPRWNAAIEAEPYGIIALGGDNGRRFNALLELSHRYPKAKLVFAGSGDAVSPEDDISGRFIRSGGDPKRLIRETRSRLIPPRCSSRRQASAG